MKDISELCLTDYAPTNNMQQFKYQKSLLKEDEGIDIIVWAHTLLNLIYRAPQGQHVSIHLHQDALQSVQIWKGIPKETVCCFIRIMLLCIQACGSHTNY